MGLLARSLLVTLAVVVALAGVTPDDAQAQAVITNGTVTLGINNEGDLIVEDPATLSPVGLRFTNATDPANVTSFDGIAPGCKCEGWGVAIVDDPAGPFTGHVEWDTSVSPPARVVTNLTLSSFVSDATSALSVVTINDASGSPALEVTHEFLPSASPNVYRVNVTIRNVSGRPLGTTSTSLRYRRVMDWDVEPTAQSEFVTIGGIGSPRSTNLTAFSNNGFASANPLVSVSPITIPDPSIDHTVVNPCLPDFVGTDCGPFDHGAHFDFSFPGLGVVAGVDDSRSFTIFYGAAATEAAANEALLVTGIEVFSYGQCNAGAELLAPTCGQGVGAPPNAAGAPATFIFGFGGVGGVPVFPASPPPPPPPPPAAGDPELCVAPRALKFGKVPVLGSRELEFVIQNVGTGTLLGAAGASGPFSVVRITCSAPSSCVGNSFSLTEGQGAVVTVRFSPTSEAVFTGNVTVTATINGLETAQILIARGRGVVPQLGRRDHGDKNTHHGDERSPETDEDGSKQHDEGDSDKRLTLAACRCVPDGDRGVHQRDKDPGDKHHGDKPRDGDRHHGQRHGDEAKHGDKDRHRERAKDEDDDRNKTKNRLVCEPLEKDKEEDKDTHPGKDKDGHKARDAERDKDHDKRHKGRDKDKDRVESQENKAPARDTGRS